MKKYSLLYICMFACFTINTQEQCSITLKSKWRELDTDHKKIAAFGGKWMLVGSITFKKRCKEPLSIDTMSLRWNGESIDNLIASLYKKDFTKDFIPIEKNVICDGIWNKTKQTLIFNFDEKETLSPTTTFYLVLTIPENIEHILTKGTFLLDEQSLPKPFKQRKESTELSLVINEKKQILKEHTT